MLYDAGSARIDPGRSLLFTHCLHKKRTENTLSSLPVILCSFNFT